MSHKVTRLLLSVIFMVCYADGCSETLSMEERRDEANVIVTGIAASISDDTAEVNIFQVLKNDSGSLSNHPQVISIRGFNNPDICDSAIEVSLLKIIMIALNNGIYTLNSSLVDVSIESLNIMRDTPNPCDRARCSYGFTCQVEDGDATCKCVSCPDPVNETPVCGTNDIQYASECYLQRAVCSQSIQVSVAKYGPCVDPCARITCQYGSICVPNYDQRSANCECPEICTLEYNPICTESGVQYANQCALDQHRCQIQADVGIRYYGECDPCSSFSCPEDTVCRIDEKTRQPVCSCGQQCIATKQPVCGSDGLEYNNECELQKAACIENKAINVINQGSCNNDPCDMVTCNRYQECVRSETYGACSCMFNCPDIYNPVCGVYEADDATQNFDSHCHMKLSACRQQRDINLLSYGLCENVESSYISACESHTCPLGESCSLNANNEAMCECASSCDAYPYSAVCGSNFKTYRNLCELKRNNCVKKTEVDVLYDEACPDPCDNMICENYALCVGAEATGQCVCPTDDQCASADRHEIVCGSDGVTYQDICEMKKTSCNTNTPLTVSYYGYCFKDDACLDVRCNKYASCDNGQCICEECDDLARNPVCATNNESFETECEMRRYACMKSEDISIYHTGTCINDNFGNEFDLDQKLLWKCSEKCIGGSCNRVDNIWQCVCPSCENDPPINAICGENNVTYSSECFLKRAMCMQHQYIDILHYGQCQSNSRLCPQNTEIITDPNGYGYLTCKSGDHCPVSSICHYQNCCFNHTIADDCTTTRYGCCDDRQTHALGSRKQGCPEMCTCNPYGSYGSRCDAFNQCVCHRGVVGKQCDRCIHGYWNFLRMVPTPSIGCQECKCNLNGSQRLDCDQTNGHCLCKDGVFGEKCNLCPIGFVLSPEGCVTEEELANQRYYQSCDSVKCDFGGTCVQRDIYARCECPTSCPDHNDDGTVQTVCASDGESYKSECSMIVTACAQGKNITVRSYSECGVELPGNVERESSASQSDSITRVNECVLDPCLHGGECIPTETGHRCICPIGFGLTDCREIIHVKIPKFEKYSYVEFPQLVAYQNQTIEISVKPGSDSGIIIYIGPNEVDHSSQFFALILNRGILELRYSYGDDRGIVTTALSLTMDTWHRIVVRHFSNAITLMVDYDEQLQSGMILRSTTKVLSAQVRLTDNIKIGGVSRYARGNVFKFFDLKEGFTGCMTNFVVNGVSIDMSYPDSSELVGGAGVTTCDYNPCKTRECQNGATCVVEDSYNYHCICQIGFDGKHCEYIDNPCLDSPCESGGTCQVITNKSFKCFCPLGRRGLTCEKEIRMDEQDVFMPSFNLDSFLKAEKKLKAERNLDIEIWFYTRKLEGLLLFAGQSPDSDFIALVLTEDHRVQFQFDLGTGIESVSATEKLTPHTWYKVVIHRTDFLFDLCVNDGTHYLMTSTGNLMTLNLDTPLFVGGYSDISSLVRTGAESGFKGAVQKLVVNGDVLIGNRTVEELNDVFGQASNVMRWDNHECFTDKPCPQSEKCLPVMEGHVCGCPQGDCDQASLVMGDKPIALYFAGNQVLSYYNAKKKREFSQEVNKFQIGLRTTTGNGLILWSKEGSMKDMFALSLWNGFVKAEVELGAGKMETYSIKAINDGKWHEITVSRNIHVFNLQVDNEANIRSYLPSGASKLDTDGLLWVGGHPFLSLADADDLPVNIRNPFIGCISYLNVGDSRIDFVQDLVSDETLQYCTD